MNLKDKIRIRDATICIVGLGYVGLPTAIAFAKKGFKVIGADKKEDVVKSLNNGISHLKDLGLGADLRSMVKAGMFRATTDTTKATEESDVIIICVPTPVHPDKTPDLQPIISAGEDIARGLSRDRKRLVVLESTVYPGVTEEILAPILEESVWRSTLQAGMDFGLAHVPERYNPGDEKHGINDVVRVVGGITPEWTNITGELYKNIAKDVYKVPDIKTAEAAKIIENIQRDLNIALMNELALIFERMDIDINAVIGAAKTKWNFHTYYPGAGVGGECLAGQEYIILKDNQGVSCVQIAEEYNKVGTEEKKIKANGTTIVQLKNTEILSFDTEQNKFCFMPANAISCRDYNGTMLKVLTSDGRAITITNGHPMVVWINGATHIKYAEELKSGDDLVIQTSLEGVNKETKIDILDYLAANEKTSANIRVKPKKTQYKDYKKVLTTALKEVGYVKAEIHEVYRRNQMPLKTYLKMECQEILHIPHADILLCTGRGPSARTLPAVISLNADFARLIGYYLSEGCVVEETTTLRTYFSFNSNEKEYIDDVCSILNSMGVCYSKRNQKIYNALSIKVSSKLFGILIRDILGCGTNSYNKQIPKALFLNSKEQDLNVLSGILRGDGGVSIEQGTRTYYHTKKRKQYTHNRNCCTVDYYSSSPTLFQQSIILAQSLGFMPTIKKGQQLWRLYGYENMNRLKPIFGGNGKKKLESYIANGAKPQKSKIFTNHGSGIMTVKVDTITKVEDIHTVYSLEVEDTHTFVTSFGIVTHNCLPADPYYLTHRAEQLGYHSKVILAGRAVNDYMPFHIFELLKKALDEHGRSVKGSKITVLGVSYKENVGDLKGSPSLVLINELKKWGAEITVIDPYVSYETLFKFGNPEDTIPKAVKGSDALILMTAHKGFKDINYFWFIKDEMRTPIIIDGRRIFDQTVLESMGFKYKGVGAKNNVRRV